MSWIQENKFTAALAGVTAIGSIALISLSMGKSDDLDSTQMKLKKALRNEAEIQRVQPFPNQENLDEKKSIVKDYSTGARRLQRQFAAYRPKAEEVKDFAPDKFSAIVSGYRDRLNNKFKHNGVELPEGCVYGFEAYSNKFPRPAATGELSYQVKATEWLLTMLARNKPEALLNVVRAKFALETAPVRVKNARNRRGRVKEPVYYAMPLELSFRCSEEGVSNFLAQIANTNKYAFVIRSVRFQNERMTPPTQSDAKFAVEVTSGNEDDVFGFGANFAESDSVTSEAMTVDDSPVLKEAEVPTVGSDNDDKRLLLPVLGGEEVNVFLKLDLILLNQTANLILDEAETRAELESTSPTH